MVFNRKLVLKKNVIEKENVPDCLDGFSILHLSDTHFKERDSHTEEIKELLKNKKYDLCVLTGDYVRSNKAIKNISCFKSIKTRYGTYAILGNHDYRFDLKKLTRSFNDIHIPVLINQHKKIVVGKDAKKTSLYVIGLDVHVYDDVNRWVLDRADIKRAMRGIPSDDGFTIVLSHSPDMIEKAVDERADLVFSGHTHGGQICLPGIGPVYASSRYGTKYAYGLYKEKKTHMHVTRGIGSVKINIFGSRLKVPLSDIRINCKPEISIIILRKKKSDAEKAKTGDKKQTQ